MSRSRQKRVSIVLTTIDRRPAAERLAREAVADRLAACVQMLPVRSVYRWQGKIERAAEWLLVFKTARVRALTAFLRQQHSYQLPEIVSVPVSGGLDAYLDWVRKETSR